MTVPSRARRHASPTRRAPRSRWPRESSAGWGSAAAAVRPPRLPMRSSRPRQPARPSSIAWRALEVPPEWSRVSLRDGSRLGAKRLVETEIDTAQVIFPPGIVELLGCRHGDQRMRATGLELSHRFENTAERDLRRRKKGIDRARRLVLRLRVGEVTVTFSDRAEE